jgi:hypothetical protein
LTPCFDRSAPGSVTFSVRAIPRHRRRHRHRHGAVGEEHGLTRLEVVRQVRGIARQLVRVIRRSRDDEREGLAERAQWTTSPGIGPRRISGR